MPRAVRALPGAAVFVFVCVCLVLLPCSMLGNRLRLSHRAANFSIIIKVNYPSLLQVMTRFRPARHAATNKKLVLPLHQRLKLMNKRERLDLWGVEDATERDDNVGLSAAAVEKLAACEPSLFLIQRDDLFGRVRWLDRAVAALGKRVACRAVVL